MWSLFTPENVNLFQFLGFLIENKKNRDILAWATSEIS